jgi:ubiquinone/menaquinone biosynthesis C-methylase UbiE
MEETPTGALAFEANAENYERTIARTLAPVARRVVERAALQPGESVLDVGTGTGTAAAFAMGDGRTVVGVDGSPAMIELARHNVPDATFHAMDFAQLEFPDGRFDVVVASHSLLFADDRLAALREWLRVTRPAGRLSLSVPGPETATPTTVFGDVYERHGIRNLRRYPTVESLTEDVRAAGWVDVESDADPTVTIRLANEGMFRAWRSIGTLGMATRDWRPEQHEALTADMLLVAPRDADGAYVLPFGALYLSAVAA